MNTTTIDYDDRETVLQSGLRQWIENREREQQERDERFVEWFLAGKLKQKSLR